MRYVMSHMCHTMLADEKRREFGSRVSIVWQLKAHKTKMKKCSQRVKPLRDDNDEELEEGAHNK